MPVSEEQLVTEHAPMVRRLALQLISRLPSSVELDDLLQAGMMGLLDAVRRYQQVPEAQFETYAVTRIRGAMLDELRTQDWLPRSVRAKGRVIEQAIHASEQRLMRPATEAELAEELGVSLAEYQEMLEGAQGVQVVHYEDLSRFHGEGTRIAEEALPSDESAQHWTNPLQQIMSQGLRSALVDAISRLPEREQLLLSLQFEQDLNQKEAAAVLGVTEGRISQLRAQAIGRIRAALAQGQWDTDPGSVDFQNLL
ncbi:RNA polymerase sigma factor FliA [Neopusillimonas maritima]|jgi:RNA polymerase sigma factor for flagellar operon FliA|uniref:RNA polymerase sigma factor FliA n=1 Tax=Neopusillimonas maritima TaxID=2026239 RepID=A0A3A1YQW8_9BURK|nr:RNA polymerase sigma factor FliA [Neopusillimonas maritima]RII83949.1 RNA polymerase sigma factor FliA [Neopusillimonas maritima]RIY39911.1 RNA polymerase sigma factor FliA [Neopusillimonas maritima]